MSESEYKDPYDEEEGIDGLVYVEDVILRNFKKEGWVCVTHRTSNEALKCLKILKEYENNLDPKIIIGINYHVVYLRRESLFRSLDDLVGF